MLKAVLVSPQFLFITPSKEAPTGEKIVPLDDYQIASRLSYLLWATLPDAELSKLADEGKLHEPAVLKAQTKRLLADKRSRALFDGFGAQWLGLDTLATKTFDAQKFPQMTPEMRSAMYDEARLFFDSIVRENRSVVSFVSADYTFLNRTLASLYGLENKITGSVMQKVSLTDANRGGILAMPGILATTSFATRTSAVKRGVWVMDRLLNDPAPPPPPGISAVDPDTRGTTTVREQLDKHRADTNCAECHAKIDPTGFALEAFDPIGGLRDRYRSNGQGDEPPEKGKTDWRVQYKLGPKVDPSGTLTDGRSFTGPNDLNVLLTNDPARLARAFIAHLSRYATGTEVSFADRAEIRRIVAQTKTNGYGLRSLLHALAQSPLFISHSR
jgi:hypothetical protein